MDIVTKKLSTIQVIPMIKDIDKRYIDELVKVCNEYNIPVIEDAAESLGSRYKGQKCGSFGDFGILSFNGNKMITTSGGGALVTKNLEYKKKAVFLATQARDDAPHYQHSHVGYNYRMSNVLAGIGRGQMEVLDDRVRARRANFEFYKASLGHFSQIEFVKEPEGYFSNRWLSCILTPSFEIRENIRLALLKDDVESRPLWKPMHQQPIFEKHPQYIDGTSDQLFHEYSCIALYGIGTGLTYRLATSVILLRFGEANLAKRYTGL